jgi:hypothetical protein
LPTRQNNNFEQLRFQRECTANLELNKEEWKAKILEAAQGWADLSERDKEAYHVEASHQQQKRDQWMATPLATDNDGAVSDVGTRFSGKVKFERLGLNQDIMEKHASWNAGLGLCDHRGALKASLLDTSLSDDFVKQQLGKTFHKNDDAPRSEDESGEDEPHQAVCHAVHNQCCKNATVHQVAHYVKGLAHFQKRYNLFAGALLRFRFVDSLTSELCFLGAVVTKPYFHIFIRAESLGGNIASLSMTAEKNAPIILSSHALFQKMLANHMCEDIVVEELTYSMNLDAGMVLLKVFTTGLAHQGLIGPSHDLQKPRQPQAILPFGLTLPKRPRRAKAKAKPKALAVGQPHLVAAQTASADPNTNSDSGSTTSSSSSTSSSDSDAGPEEQGIATTIEPTTVDAVHEADAVEGLTAEREEEDIAAQHLGPLPPPKTFFSAEIGFSEADLSPMRPGRLASCYCCSQPVQKGTIRFAYHFHPKRPSRWFHAECVLRFVASDVTRKEQAQKAFQGFSQDANEEVADKSSAILLELNGIASVL